MKYEILAYSHCGQCLYKVHVEANNKIHAKQIFNALSYPSDSIEEIYYYTPELPHFITMDEAIVKGEQWKEMRKKRRLNKKKDKT